MVSDHLSHICQSLTTRSGNGTARVTGEPVDLRPDFLRYCYVTALLDACWRLWSGQEDPVSSVLRIVFKKGFWVSSNALAAYLGKLLCFFHLKLSMQWIILITLNVESCLKITSTSYNELNNFFRCSFWYQLFIELFSCFCHLGRVAPTGLSGDPLWNMSGPGTGEQKDPDLDAASASTVHLQSLPHFICKSTAPCIKIFRV